MYRQKLWRLIKLKDKDKISKFLYFSVLVSFVVPILYLTVRIILMSAGQLAESTRPMSDYILMLLECVLGVIVIHLPSFLEKKFNFEIPRTLYIMYLIFLYCAIFLGEIRNYYYHVPHWDSILHTLSSLMSGAFGFMVVDILNQDKHTSINLSPLFVSVFAFCFSVTFGTLWEIYEFSFDALLGLNMQKFRLANGTLLVGHEALTDTMKDIILDTLGAFMASLIGFLYLKGGRRRSGADS